MITPPVTIWNDNTLLPYRAWHYHAILYAWAGYDKYDQPNLYGIYSLN